MLLFLRRNAASGNDSLKNFQAGKERVLVGELSQYQDYSGAHREKDEFYHRNRQFYRLRMLSLFSFIISHLLFYWQFAFSRN